METNGKAKTKEIKSVEVYNDRKDKENSKVNHGKNTKEKEAEWKRQVTGKRCRIPYVTVEPVLVLFFMPYVIVNFLMPQWLFTEFAERRNYTSSANSSNGNGYCLEDIVNSTTNNDELLQKVQGDVARYLLYIDIAGTIPDILISAIAGPISDIIGRKPAMIIPLCGELIRFLTIFFIQLWKLPVELVILAPFVGGVFGGRSTIISACYAYIADVVPPDKRSQRIVIITVSFSIGISITHLYLGYFIKAAGFMYPMILCMGINLLNLLYIITILRDSRKRQKDKKLFSLSYTYKALQVLLQPTIKMNGWKLRIATISFVLCVTMQQSRRGLTNLFLMNSPLCWDSVMLGSYIAATGLFSDASDIFMTFLVVQYLGEERSTVVASFSNAVSLVLLSVSTRNWMTYLGNILNCSQCYNMRYLYFTKMISHLI